MQKIHYQLEGEGAPLLLIHGVGADLESWEGVIADLQRKYRTLRADLRGHGKSEKSPGPYSLDMFCADCIGLLDELQIERTHLVGFSLGGLVAQKLALDYARRFLSLTVVSSVAGRTEEEKRKVAARAQLLQDEGPLSHLANAVDRWFTDDFRLAHPEVLEKRWQKSLQNDPDCYLAAYRVLAEEDLADQLDGIELPTLTMTGENDIGSTPRMSQLIADTVKNGRCVILPNLKHSVLLEAPKLIAAELNAFISARNSG